MNDISPTDPDNIKTARLKLQTDLFRNRIGILEKSLLQSHKIGNAVQSMQSALRIGETARQMLGVSALDYFNANQEVVNRYRQKKTGNDGFFNLSRTTEYFQ